MGSECFSRRSQSALQPTAHARTLGTVHTGARLEVERSPPGGALRALSLEVTCRLIIR